MKIDELESTDLESLVGKHYLTGVDYDTESIKHYSNYEDCQVVRFRLDGITYMAVENPDDGYRSMMRGLFVVEDDVKNKFSRVQVNGVMRKGSYTVDDVLQLWDVKSGKLVLEVGTGNIDDYYPSFVGAFYPENLILNQQ